MNMTSRPFGPRALSSVWRRPSMPGRSNCAAGHPSATGDVVVAMESSSSARGACENRSRPPGQCAVQLRVVPAIDFFVVITPRIFVGDDVHALADGAEYALPAAAARHVAQALRMRVGQPLALFTGAGGEYAAAIERIDRRDVVVRVERHDAIERESVHAVTLVQSVIAADMMDWVVRKAVELGAAAIAPIRSARSQGVSSEREERRA